MEATAKLRNYPTSPTKMRLVADLIRGMDIEKALIELQFSTKHSAGPLKKLLLSAVSNWKQANEGVSEEGLFVKTIFVDSARVLKRMLPAPQGRAYRIKKRSNHVTIIVDQREAETKKEQKAVVYAVEDKKVAKKSTQGTDQSKTMTSEPKMLEPKKSPSSAAKKDTATKTVKKISKNTKK